MTRAPIAAAAMTMLAAQPLFAEEITQMDPVVSTATRTGRSQFDTPDTVGVVDLEEIELLQPNSLGDILKHMPGVEIGAGPRAVAQQPNIRGLGGSRILITLDGARQNFTSGHKGRVFVEPELLKRVEVLRGSGSAVWGSNALGGVIAMTTKDAGDFLLPDEDWGVRLRGGYQGVNDEGLGSAILFGRLGSAADVLLSGSYSDSDDVTLGGGEILEDSAEEVYASLAKFNWRPAPGHELRFSRQYNFETGEVPSEADQQTSATAVLTDRETEVITNRIAYGYDPASRWIDLRAAVYVNPQTIREKRIGTEGRLDVIEFETRGADLQNSSVFQLGGGHRLTYGVEAYTDKQASVRGNVPSLIFPSATADFIGAYVQDEYELRGVHVIPGLRYDSYQSNTDVELATQAGSASEISEQQVSPKFGLVWPLMPDLNLALNAGKSFRAPTFQELYISGVHFGANNFVPNFNLRPETGVTREAGLRYRNKGLWDGRDSANAIITYYDNRYEDFIEGIVTTTTTTFVNVSEVRISGVEAEASYRFAAIGLEAGVSYSAARGDDLTGNEPLGSIPGYKTVVHLDQELFGNLLLGARGSFNRPQDRVREGQPITPEYNLFDIYAAWAVTAGRLHEFKINFGVDNLTDELYTPHLSTLPGAGRNVKASVTAQF